ncbi:MAG: hypothetical protein GX338_03455 [Firmicutes bacterium]|nr:hypothetical protein [Bacillota bacterium]
MKDSIRQVAAECLQTILLDEPWQDFGFRRRPRYGARIQKLRSAWKVALEETLLQQMLSMLLAAYFMAGAIESHDLQQIIDSYTCTNTLWSALGYRSQDEARRDLRRSTNKYVDTPENGWSNVLLSRIDLDSVPKSSTAARLFMGCALFTLNVQRMIGLLAERYSDDGACHL